MRTMDNNNHKIISLVFLILLSSSCGWLQPTSNGSDLQNEDEFYSISKVGDLYRFPLIKPFEVFSTIGYGPDWFVNLKYGNDFKKDQISIDSVSVTDSLIIAYSDGIYLPGEMTKAWFIIDVKEKKELAFRTEDEYLQYIKERGIVSVKLYHPNTIYTEFKDSKILPW